MPWQRPTLKQLYERTSGDFSGRLLDGGAVLSRSVISVFAKVWSGVANALHAALEWSFRQEFVDTAEGVHMERWANAYAIYRKSAAFAEGKALFEGNIGGIIPANTLMQNQETSQQYYALEDAEVIDGVATVSIRAVEAGALSNAVQGQELSFISPLAGMQSAGEVDADGLTGGVDEEDDESLRARVLLRLRQPPRGGSKSDYEQWALQVPGVTRAWCYPLGAGVGTVTLTFVTDDSPDGPIPSAEMVQRVQEYIEPLRPASVKEWVAFAPELYELDMRLYITPDTEAIREDVRKELTDFIAREGVPGAILYISRINEAISLAPGEFDHVLFEPAQNVEVPAGFFPVLRNVIFVDAKNIEV